MEGDRLIPAQINIGTKTVSDSEFLGLISDALNLMLTNEGVSLTTKVNSRTISPPSNKYPAADLLSVGNQELYEKPLIKEDYILNFQLLPQPI